MARQLVRSEQVRAAIAGDNLLSNAQVKAVQVALDSGVSSTDIDSAELTQAILSQLRYFEGGATWTDQAPPDPNAGHEQRFNEAVVGVQDGTNTVFYAQFYFVPSTLSVSLNGNAIYQGTGDDYTVAESGGVGTGYDTITLFAYADCAPLPQDKVRISYTRSGGPSTYVLP